VKAMKRRVFEEIWMTFIEKIGEKEEEEAEATNTVNGKYLDRFFSHKLGLTKKMGENIS